VANRFARPAQAEAKAAVVRKGDPVQLMAGNSVFSVSRMMVADEDGAMGETIRVREDKKSQPIFAQVVEMGVVRIPGFNNF
jgi:flagella basal body P-ring formation protein FlgA